MAISVPYEELKGSPKVRLSGGKMTGTRVFRVAWSDRVQMMGDLYGSYKTIGGVPSYTPPDPFPGFPWLIAKDIDIEPFDEEGMDGDGAPNNYTSAGALVTATYEQVDNDEDAGSNKPEVDNGTYLTYSSEIGAEYLTVPGRTWSFTGLTGADAKLPDDEPAGIKIPTESFTLSWTRVPRPPFAAARKMRGMLNNAIFNGFDIGTVLFLGAKYSREFQAIDLGLWKVDYMFEVKAVESTASPGTVLGWNHFYSRKAVAGEHWLTVKDEDNNLPYKSGNFSTLFVQA